MADQRLRELQRAEAAGDAEAPARVLTERLRLGELTDRDLELLAYLEHEPAHQVLGWSFERADGRGHHYSTPGTRSSKVDPICLSRFAEGWIAGLRSWGSSVVLRVGVAVVRRVWLPDWESMSTTSRLPASAVIRLQVKLALQIADRCCVFPDSSLVHAAAMDPTLRTRTTPLSPYPAIRLMEACYRPSECERWVGRACEEEVITRFVNADFHAAVIAELVPWILKERDPARERIPASCREDGRVVSGVVERTDQLPSEAVDGEVWIVDAGGYWQALIWAPGVVTDSRPAGLRETEWQPIVLPRHYRPERSP